LIRLEVIKYLLKFAKEYDCVIPQWENGYLEPLCAIYSIKKGLESAKFNLEKGYYKLTKIIKEGWKVKYVSIENELKNFDSELVSFININRIKDLENLKNHL